MTCKVVLKRLYEQPCVDFHITAIRDLHPIGRISWPEPHGTIAAMYMLHIDECPPRNRTRHEKAWMAANARARVLMRMRKPVNPVHYGLEYPLAGRPQVLCFRYSSVEPDALAGWAKIAVDCLQPSGVRRGKPYEGLGIIASDKPKDAEIIEVWHPAKPGKGFCVIEVWTGTDGY